MNNSEHGITTNFMWRKKKHLKNVLVGKKKPLCQSECQKRRVNLAYQLWKSLGVCKLWDNVTLSQCPKHFFPFTPRVPKLTVSWYFIALWTPICRDLGKSLFLPITFFFSTFFFFSQELFFLFLWMEIAMYYSFPCLFDKDHYLCLS